MADLATQVAKFGDSNNTLWLKIATALQGGEAVPVATTLVFTTQPGDAEAGSPFGQQPVVEVRDQFDNPLTTYVGDVTIVKFSGPGTLSGDNVVPVNSGNAPFSDLEFDTAGTYVLRATIASPALHVNSSSFAVASDDPLAGITFSLRIQSHAGFGATPNAPLGLYQDVACTIPAVDDGDPIAGIRDTFNGNVIVATQSDEQKQGMLLDGAIFYDGVDDCYELVEQTIDDNTVFIGANFGTKEDQYLLGRAAGDPLTLFGFDDNAQGMRFLSFSGGYFGGLKRGDVDESWHVFSLTLATLDGTLRIDGAAQSGTVTVGQTFEPNMIGAYSAGRFFSGSMTAILIPAAASDNTQKALIENFIATLAP